MRTALLVVLLVSALPAMATAQGPVSPAAGAESSSPPETAETSAAPSAAPTVVAAYPDPVAHDDVGEFVVVSLPAAVDPSSYSLTDGETTHPLVNATAGERIAVANDASAANLTDHPVVVESSLSLANTGERLAIRRNGSTVSEREYRDAPEGEVARWNGSAIRWRPVGATDRPVVRGSEGTVRAFVLPDAPAVPAETLRRADRRILLGGYTLASERIVDALRRAHERDVDVTVLLEGDPVSGRTQQEADLLDELVAAGVDVRVLGGSLARYDYHHAKYAVVDDRALVMTENWKPAGTGGNSSRGWGVVTNQTRVVDGLAETFRADAGWRDATDWSAFRTGREFERGERARGGYPARHDPTSVNVARTDLLVTPDNAKRSLVDAIDRANDSIAVVQVSMGEWDSPLLTALRRAAQRGVDVRILLGGDWYVREENRALADRFDEWAAERDAPLTAKLADPGDRYEKIHAKGAVVDEDSVVLGSLNWNEQAATSNREVILVLHGRDVADYYGEVFDADWRGGRPGLPVGVVGAILGCLVLAGLVARRLEFEK